MDYYIKRWVTLSILASDLETYRSQFFHQKVQFNKLVCNKEFTNLISSPLLVSGAENRI